MVCCNLSVVRGTESPGCIECTTLGFKLNPMENVEIRAFIAAPVCRATVMPAEALVPRAKSYAFQKTFKNLGKIIVSPIASRGRGKLEWKLNP